MSAAVGGIKIYWTHDKDAPTNGILIGISSTIDGAAKAVMHYIQRNGLQREDCAEPYIFVHKPNIVIIDYGSKIQYFALVGDNLDIKFLEKQQHNE